MRLPTHSALALLLFYLGGSYLLIMVQKEINYKKSFVIPPSSGALVRSGLLGSS